MWLRSQPETPSALPFPASVLWLQRTPKQHPLPRSYPMRWNAAKRMGYWTYVPRKCAERTRRAVSRRLPFRLLVGRSGQKWLPVLLMEETTQNAVSGRMFNRIVYRFVQDLLNHWVSILCSAWTWIFMPSISVLGRDTVRFFARKLVVWSTKENYERKIS